MPRLTPALTRAFDILELFYEYPDGLSAAEIVERTGLPRTTVHELLVTMVERKYLQRDGTGMFRLGISTFRLGNTFGDRLDLYEVGLRVAKDVVASCNETANVGILDGLNVVYLCKVDSRQPVRMISRAGGAAPASCTGVGKALLAFLPQAALERLAQEFPLPRLTPNSITDPAEFLGQMREIRERGVAFEFGESTMDVSCAAAPVRDHTGAVVASLSVSVPDMRWSQRPRQEWADIVVAGAQQMSRELGAR